MNKERIEFFLPMIPPTVTHQEKKISMKRGRQVVYEPPELAKARAKLMGALAPYVPEHPYDGALRLVVKWCFPIIKGTYNGKYKHTKPDTDNLNKMLKDCMESLGFFVNDSRVASEIIEKFWASTTGIYICLERIHERNGG